MKVKRWGQKVVGREERACLVKKTRVVRDP
jgi:hypothetical protein